MDMRIVRGAILTGAGVFFGLLLVAPQKAFAEDLNKVLSNTYLGNPDLKSARANLRAIDEEMPRARSGFRPQVNFDADVSANKTDTDPPAAGDGRWNSHGYSLSVVQPVFRGFRTLNSIRQVDATILAGREDLRATEQQVFLSAVTAYVDVIRDRAILRLRQNNVNVLAEQLRATQDRFDVGEVTKTDVAQARASHSGAISLLNLAKANLKSSRAIFEQVVGYNPNSLSSPRPIDKFLPRTLDEAMRRAMEEHPSILGSVYREEAAVHSVDTIRGELLPTVNIQGTISRDYDPSRLTDERTTGVIQGTLSVPIYQGGEVSARVRQAKQTALQRRDELEASRKSVRAELIASWGQVTSFKAQLIADRVQVSANQTALDGVREEEKVGQRTVLDVLNAQQTLLNSQVQLTTSQRDLVVATYRLLAATGRLTAHDLGLDVPKYIPEAHYDQVRRQWIGTGVQEYSDGDFENRALVRDRYFPEALK